MLIEQVQVDVQRQYVRCMNGNIMLLEQRCDAGRRPYIHPLRPCDGQGILSEDSPDHHPWQHGIYTGLHGVNGSDFWLDQGDGTGRIEPQPPVLAGDAGWTTRSLWRHHHGHALLEEKQTWSLSVCAGAYALDLDWSLTALCDVHVDQAAYGGLFIRMPFTPEKHCVVYNSEGQADDDCEQAAAAWVAVHMDIDGRHDGAGMAVMDHPQNQTGAALWRVDQQRGINPSPCIAGPLLLTQAQERIWRYRIFIFSGAVNQAHIQNVFSDFTQGK